MQLSKDEIENLISEKITFAEKKYGKDVKMLLIETLSFEKMLKAESLQTRYIPVVKWNEYHPYPTVASMQMRVFYEDTNGFKEFGVVHRDGKRVLIDEQAYFKWQKDKDKRNKTA